MEGEVVNVGGVNPAPTPGSAGVQSQVAGAATTVSNVAAATGGMGAESLVQRDLDEELYKFKSDDTPLMQLMLKAKKVKVTSPEVDHYMIDEPRSNVTSTTEVSAGAAQQFILPLLANDASIPRPYGTCSRCRQSVDFHLHVDVRTVEGHCVAIHHPFASGKEKFLLTHVVVVMRRHRIAASPVGMLDKDVIEAGSLQVHHLRCIVGIANRHHLITFSDRQLERRFGCKV